MPNHCVAPTNGIRVAMPQQTRSAEISMATYSGQSSSARPVLGSAGSVRDGVRSHCLYSEHQGGMVGLRMPQCGARLHQLGRTGDLQQGQAQRAGSFKR